MSRGEVNRRHAGIADDIGAWRRRTPTAHDARGGDHQARAEPAPGRQSDGFDLLLSRYARPRSEAVRAVERAVLGDAVGLNGYTTLEQAWVLRDRLALAPLVRLLEIGAGQGWPGSHLAESSGCGLVATDIAVDGLRTTKDRLTLRPPAGSAHVVAADGRALPFRTDWFDAVVHADVFC